MAEENKKDKEENRERKAAHENKAAEGRNTEESSNDSSKSGPKELDISAMSREELLEMNKRRLEVINNIGEDIFQNQKSALADKWKHDEMLSNEFLESSFMDSRREYFLDNNNASYAYYEQDLNVSNDVLALDISTVIELFELAHIKPGMKVLLIGCGTGYEEDLLIRMRCQVDVLHDNMRSIDYSRAKLEVLYENEDKIPAYFTHLSEIKSHYDRVIGLRSVPKLRKELFSFVDVGRMVMCLGDEKILVTLDFDGTKNPVMKFIGSLWLPPISLDSIEGK